MEITGRITRDAVVTALKDERTVINFNLAVPGGYKDKNGVWVDRTEFVRCAYWLNSGAARLLTKGTVVQLYGRISANVFRNSDGEAKAGLQFHTSAFKVIAGMAKKNQPAKGKHVQTVSEGEDDNLPF
jgi:single-strand DNA-binding protein